MTTRDELVSADEAPRVCDHCGGRGGGQYGEDFRARWERCAACDGWGYDRPSLVAWAVEALRALAAAKGGG